MFRRGILWGIVIFTLLPLIILAFYNLPLGDDLHCAAIMQAKGLVDGFEHLNSHWNSRYVQSVLLLAFNPASYNNLNLFWLPPLVLIFGFSISLFGLLKLIAGKTVSKNELFSLYVIILFLYFNYLPGIGETLFWISGSYTYQLPVILMLNAVSLYALLIRANSKFKKLIITLALIVLSFLLVGLHEEAIAYLIGFSFIITIWHFFKRDNNGFYLFIVLAVSIAFTFLVIGSPAFASKGSSTGFGSRNILSVGFESFGRSLFYLMTWVPAFIIIFYIIHPVTTKISDNLSLTPFSKKTLLLFASTSILIVTAGFFVPVYATGWMPPRSVSIPFFIFIVLFFIIVLRVENPLKLSLSDKQKDILLILLVLIMGAGHNIFDAYTDISAGKAKTYHSFIQANYSNMMRAEEGDTVLVKPLPNVPVLMPVRWPQYKRDLSCAEMSRYFNVYVDVE